MNLKSITDNAAGVVLFLLAVPLIGFLFEVGWRLGERFGPHG